MKPRCARSARNDLLTASIEDLRFWRLTIIEYGVPRQLEDLLDAIKREIRRRGQ